MTQTQSKTVRVVAGLTSHGALGFYDTDQGTVTGDGTCDDQTTFWNSLTLKGFTQGGSWAGSGYILVQFDDTCAGLEGVYKQAHQGQPLMQEALQSIHIVGVGNDTDSTLTDLGDANENRDFYGHGSGYSGEWPNAVAWWWDAASSDGLILVEGDIYDITFTWDTWDWAWTGTVEPNNNGQIVTPLSVETGLLANTHGRNGDDYVIDMLGYRGPLQEERLRIQFSTSDTLTIDYFYALSITGDNELYGGSTWFTKDAYFYPNSSPSVGWRWDWGFFGNIGENSAFRYHIHYTEDDFKEFHGLSGGGFDILDNLNNDAGFNAIFKR